MNYNENGVSLRNTQKIILFVFSIFISVFIFFFRGQFTQRNYLEDLASSSMEPQLALSNGKPTMFEFYADWCEVCREMAPFIFSVKNNYQDKIDIVMLNVENPEWDDYIDKYDVNGIPQLNLFDYKGDLTGRIIGAKTESEIEEIVSSLLVGEKINKKIANISHTRMSNIDKIKNSQLQKVVNSDPKSHG